MKRSLVSFALLACIAAASVADESGEKTVEDATHEDLERAFKKLSEKDRQKIIQKVVSAAEEHAADAMEKHREYQNEVALIQKKAEAELMELARVQTSRVPLKDRLRKWTESEKAQIAANAASKVWNYVKKDTPTSDSCKAADGEIKRLETHFDTLVTDPLNFIEEQAARAEANCQKALDFEAKIDRIYSTMGTVKTVIPAIKILPFIGPLANGLGIAIDRTRPGVKRARMLPVPSTTSTQGPSKPR